jgi:hypothetical protein
MASKGVILVAAGLAVAVGAGAVAYGLGNRSGSKGATGKQTAGKTTPKPPPLKPVCALDVDGTLAKEYTVGDTQLSESYALTTVFASKDGSDPQGAYKGRVEGTFEGTGRQKKLNTTEQYKGKIAKGSITFSLTDNGYGTLSGQGSMSLQCKVTSGTATNKYGTAPVRGTTTVVIPIKVTVEGSSATVTAKGGSGSLMGTFRAPPR